VAEGIKLFGFKTGSIKLILKQKMDLKEMTDIAAAKTFIKIRL
jgi:hypothetical protein